MSKGRKNIVKDVGPARLPRRFAGQVNRVSAWLALATVFATGLLMCGTLAYGIADHKNRSFYPGAGGDPHEDPRLFCSAALLSDRADNGEGGADDQADREAALKCLKLGLLAQKQGHTEQAEGLFLAGLKKRPGDTGLLTSLASLYFSRGDRQRAAMLLNRALEKDPHGLDTLAKFGRFQLVVRQP